MLTNETTYLEELKNGSHEAFTYFYRSYADLLYNFVLMHTRSALLTEEVVQDTFIKIWDNRRFLRTDKSFKSFLFTISKNRIIDEFRRQINQVNFEEYIAFTGNETEEGSDTDALLLYEEFLEKLERAKEELPQQQRLIFEMSREQGLKNREIAERLSISEQTVKNQLSGAMKKLKDKLKDFNVLFVFFI
ncbi:MAG: RNA polymerase sigma-70 factor [Tannerellaceae bacterium]|nr:RNA polymerase sigma-70 factor [Tannerellaceae bacterium]